MLSDLYLEEEEEMNFLYSFRLSWELLITQEEALPETININCFTLELVAERFKELF